MRSEQFFVIAGMLLAFAMFCFSIEREGWASSGIMTHERAIETANKEIAKLGYKINEMDIVVDEQNSSLHRYVEITERSISQLGPHVKRQLDQYKARLHGHTLWTVMYTFKPRNGNTVLGGALVLVDPSNGEILIVHTAH